MSEATDLLALAERVEGASGPDATLGREVLLACGWSKRQRGHFLGPLYNWASPDGKVSFDDDDFSRGRYDPTASLDAAMSLVPEASWEPYCGAAAPWNVVITSVYNRVGIHPTDGKSTGIFDKRSGNGQAATVPLALTAACLRARAQTPSTASAEGE